MHMKPANKSLSPERSAAVRARLARIVRDDFRGNVKATAKRLGVAQSQLALFTAAKTGAGLKLIEAIADYERIPLDVVIGRSYAPALGAAPLRALPSWPEAAKIASQMASPKDVDDVGGFVPPAPVSVVTALALVDLARAWSAMRAASTDADVDSGLVFDDPDIPIEIAPASSSAKKRA